MYSVFMTLQELRLSLGLIHLALIPHRQSKDSIKLAQQSRLESFRCRTSPYYQCSVYIHYYKSWSDYRDHYIHMSVSIIYETYKIIYIIYFRLDELIYLMTSKNMSCTLPLCIYIQCIYEVRRFLSTYMRGLLKRKAPGLPSHLRIEFFQYFECTNNKYLTVYRPQSSRMHACAVIAHTYVHTYTNCYIDVRVPHAHTRPGRPPRLCERR